MNGDLVMNSMLCSSKLVDYLSVIAVGGPCNK